MAYTTSYPYLKISKTVSLECANFYGNGFSFFSKFGIIQFMQQKQFANEIYKRFGAITRCRGCFLYTKKNVRLTDLFQENGRAILGWDAGNAFTAFKNFLNRGVTGSFIAEDKSRVEKAVSTLLNSNRQIFYFSKKEEALKAAILFSPQNTSIWIPWNPNNIDYSSVDCAIIEPPLPWTNTIFILAVKTDIINQHSEMIDLLPNTVKFPFPLEAGIARAIYNMISQLPERQEKNWFIYDPILTKYWIRKGPYLYTKIPQNQYDNFVLHCLECNLVINPNYNTPSIVPYGADKGVFTLLKNNPFEFDKQN